MNALNWNIIFCSPLGYQRRDIFIHIHTYITYYIYKFFYIYLYTFYHNNLYNISREGYARRGVGQESFSFCLTLVFVNALSTQIYYTLSTHFS